MLLLSGLSRLISLLDLDNYPRGPHARSSPDLHGLSLRSIIAPRDAESLIYDIRQKKASLALVF